jgi:catechol 2,3-dioxygenase-like lactoylglutathione lyase family enzyme
MEQRTNARLSHFALQARDLDRMAGFYSDLWGLDLADEDGRSRFLRADSPDHHTVGLYSGESSGLHHVAFEVEDRDQLQRLVDRVAKAGGTITYGPGPAIDEPGIAQVARFRDPDGNLVELCVGVEQNPEAYSARYVKPKGLNHVVLTVSDLKKAEAFYGDALGFRVSDWITEFMTFMRCNANHHSLALRAGTAGLDHAAFDTAGWGDIAKGVYELGEHGVPRLRGPGRHGPGNNLFAYFGDPEGNVVEYTAEVVQVDDSTWQPKHWQRPSDQWIVPLERVPPPVKPAPQK